ncbi:MAG: fluoride efflux transporter CrcB [Hyphomicrobium sp.]|nr:fluoride efflux transporter CrcB [Hyphomicrobium sp.]
MQLLLFASVGGAIGAGLRFLVNEAFAARGLLAFPWATLTVNVLGSFIMGVCAAMFVHRSHLSPELRTFVLTGVLGGFTTFSAFSMDVARLFEVGESTSALVYILSSVAVSIAAVFLGLWVARAVFS